MAAPEKFTELKQQIETAERNVRAAAAQDQAELRAKVDAARKDADERAARLQANIQQAADQGDRQWSQAQSNWDEHVVPNPVQRSSGPDHRSRTAAALKEQRGHIRSGRSPARCSVVGWSGRARHERLDPGVYCGALNSRARCGSAGGQAGRRCASADP
jgi:hypothetical protein